MKHLITGASGFVGQNLMKYLTYRNICLKSLGRSELLNCEISNFNNIDSFIHLAGKAHDIQKISNADEYYLVNFELTKRLFDAFLNSSAKKFVFISSVKAVADVVSGVLTENVDPSPLTHYGKSKLMAEDYIKSQILPDGKSYYILRPCMIHGPGNKGNLNLLYKFVEKGIPYPLAAFTNKRSFLSIENLCFIIKEILDNDIPSGIYNVSDDDAMSTAEVVAIISESLNKRPKLWQVPVKLVKKIAEIGDILNLPINSERLAKLTESYIISNKKIKEAINKALPVESSRGLLLTANSFRGHK